MITKTRFAPSPTGFLHVGSLRTALYCYLIAKKDPNGIFMLRIEDTDQSRLIPEAVDHIFEMLEVMGITPDESIKKDLGNGPYKQSERLEIYQSYLHEMVKNGFAYYCFCSTERLDELRQQQELLKLPPGYDEHCRNIPYDEARARVEAGESYTIRLKVPKARKIQFHDLVRGRLEWDSKEVDDQILLKSDGYATYFGAIVIDDALMKCTHALRGEEWIPSIPKLVLISEALQLPLPQYAHLSTIVGADRKKLSKRSGDTNVEQFLEKGFLPEAIINFIALLGWNPKTTTQEVFTLDELVQLFRIEDLHISNAFFDIEKLHWMNGQHIQKLAFDDYYNRLTTYLKKYQSTFFESVFSQSSSEYNEMVAKELQPRLRIFSEFENLSPFFYLEISVDTNLLLSEKMKIETLETAKSSLMWMQSEIENISEAHFTLESLREILLPRIAEAGMKNGQVLWPTRVALTSALQSPGAFEMLAILGKEKSSKRIRNYLENL